MAEALNMPQVGQDLTHGTIIAWRVQEGQAVKRGQVVCEVQSEKAAFEVEATVSGVLLKQLYKPQDRAEVLKPIAWIGQAGEAVPGVTGSGSAAPAAAATVPAVPVATTATTTSTSRIIASPSARRIARERGLDLAGLHGSGPGGRIVKRDCVAAPAAVAAPFVAGPMPPPPSRPAAAAPTVSASDEVIAFDRMRQIIADRLLLSRQSIPDFTVVAEVDMTAALAWRTAYNAGKQVKITINDLILRAVAQSLRQFPRLNSHVAQDRMIIKADVNIGIAVAVEKGLLVPVLARADTLDLETTAIEAKRVADDARRGVVKPGAPGTFTISNLGGLGVSRFLPIINPPECAILGVGAVEDRVVPRDGMIAIRKMLTMTLSADHRAVDGAYAAGFLRAVADHLAGCGY